MSSRLRQSPVTTPIDSLSTRFIELAGEINVAMPRYVVSRLEQALDRAQKVSLGSARVLVLGLAYKKNVADIRESPSLELMDILAERGTEVLFHDPLVGSIPKTRAYDHLAGRASVALSPERLATDHDAVDYRLVAENARLIVDTRNVFARKGIAAGTIVKA